MNTGSIDRRLEVQPQDHVQGPPTAPITLIEYGDFQCPHCGAAHAVVQQLQHRLVNNVRLVFRHFPLTKLHPRAQDAAEAAEAAGAQGKFWEMHDLLFEHHETLEPEDLASYAQDIGLDTAVFIAELASHTHAARVRDDFVIGVRVGVNGTPTFFINGVRHDGSADFPALFHAINTQLARMAA